MPPSSSSSSPHFTDSPPSCKDPELHHYQSMFLSSWNNTSALPSSSTLVPLKRFLHIENPITDTISPISSASSEPLYRCDICDVTATSEDHLKTHMAGGKHKRRVLIAETDAMLKARNDPVLEYVEVGKWKCKACKIEMCCLSLHTHLEGEKHRKKLKLWLASTAPSPALRDISVLRRQSPSPPAPAPQPRASSKSQPHPQGKRHLNNLADVSLGNSKNGASSAGQVQQPGRAGLNANAKEFLPSSPTTGRTDRGKLPPTILAGGHTQNFPSSTFSPASPRQFATAPPPNHPEMHPVPAPLPINSSHELVIGPTFFADILPEADHLHKETSRLIIGKVLPLPVPSGNQISVPFAPFGLGSSGTSAAPRLPSPVPRVEIPPAAPTRSAPSARPDLSAEKILPDVTAPSHTAAPWNVVPASAAIPVVSHIQEPPKAMLVDDAPVSQFTGNGNALNRPPAVVPKLQAPPAEPYGQSGAPYGIHMNALKHQSAETHSGAGSSGSPPLKKKKPSDSSIQTAASAPLPAGSGLHPGTSGGMVEVPAELVAAPESFSCKICSVVCNGTEPLKEHLSSKVHLKKVESSNAEKMPVASDSGGLLRHCGLCKVSVCGQTNYMEHIAGKAHTRKLRQKVAEEQAEDAKIKADPGKGEVVAPANSAPNT